MTVSSQGTGAGLHRKITPRPSTNQGPATKPPVTKVPKVLDPKFSLPDNSYDKENGIDDREPSGHGYDEIDNRLQDLERSRIRDNSNIQDQLNSLEQKLGSNPSKDDLANVNSKLTELQDQLGAHSSTRQNDVDLLTEIKALKVEMESLNRETKSRFNLHTQFLNQNNDKLQDLVKKAMEHDNQSLIHDDEMVQLLQHASDLNPYFQFNLKPKIVPYMKNGTILEVRPYKNIDWATFKEFGNEVHNSSFLGYLNCIGKTEIF